jgi:hypothetical protein
MDETRTNVKKEERNFSTNPSPSLQGGTTALGAAGKLRLLQIVLDLIVSLHLR